MPRLPTVDTYGQRPSLRSNRVDKPSTEGLDMADALGRAANTFAALAAQKKEKDDRLNYALAKNEIILSELKHRKELYDDDDYATHDTRYREKVRASRDDVYSRVPLSPEDRALLEAESDLITERGAVEVGTRSREVKREFELANLYRQLEEGGNEIIEHPDQPTANDLMLTGLDAIHATTLDEDEKVKLSQKYVSDISLGRLKAMDARDRVAALQQSLAKRKGDGPITIDDIRAGNGSDSIADFLPKDVVVKMLEESKEENRVNDVQTDVFAIIDKVAEIYKEPDAASLAARKREARAMLDRNDPEYGAKRNFLEAELTQRNAEDKAIMNMTLEEIERGLMDQIEAGNSYGQLFSGDLSRLSPAKRASLKTYAERWQDDDGFAESTNEDMYYAWTHNFTQKQKAEAPIWGAEWRTQFTRDDWNRLSAEQESIRTSLQTGKTPNIYRGDPDDEVLKNMLIGDRGVFKKMPKAGTDEYKRYLRIDGAVNRALTDESMRRYQSGAPHGGYLSPQDVREISARTIGEEVRIKEWGKDPETVVAGLSDEEKENAYVHIDRVREKSAGFDTLGNPINMEQFLRNQAGAKGDELSDRDIGKAYYLWIQGDTAGANEILGMFE